MIFTEQPEGFHARMYVVAGFVLRNDRLLMLLRNNEKDEGGKWGFPAGKRGENEGTLDALFREIEEETGISHDQLSVGRDLKTFVRYPDYDFIFHIYELHLGEDFVIRLNPGEHQNFQWATLEEALDCNLVLGNKECLELFYGIK